MHHCRRVYGTIPVMANDGQSPGKDFTRLSLDPEPGGMPPGSTLLIRSGNQPVGIDVEIDGDMEDADASRQIVGIVARRCKRRGTHVGLF